MIAVVKIQHFVARVHSYRAGLHREQLSGQAAAARAVRERLTAELLDSQDLAAAAHFPEPYFGRLVRAEATAREWIFCPEASSRPRAR